MKRIIFASVFLLLINVQAYAVDHTGTIIKYQLNGAPHLTDRGACIHMSPAIPNTWACLYETNRLYEEINALMLAAYIAKTTCTITWFVDDSSGIHIIEKVDCN